LIIIFEGFGGFTDSHSFCSILKHRQVSRFISQSISMYSHKPYWRQLFIE
jgi:hypothetical protein